MIARVLNPNQECLIGTDLYSYYIYVFTNLIVDMATAIAQSVERVIIDVRGFMSLCMTFKYSCICLQALDDLIVIPGNLYMYVYPDHTINISLLLQS